MSRRVGRRLRRRRAARTARRWALIAAYVSAWVMVERIARHLQCSCRWRATAMCRYPVNLLQRSSYASPRSDDRPRPGSTKVLVAHLRTAAKNSVTVAVMPLFADPLPERFYKRDLGRIVLNEGAQPPSNCDGRSHGICKAHNTRRSYSASRCGCRFVWRGSS